MAALTDLLQTQMRDLTTLSASVADLGTGQTALVTSMADLNRKLDYYSRAAQQQRAVHDLPKKLPKMKSSTSSRWELQQRRMRARTTVKPLAQSTPSTTAMMTAYAHAVPVERLTAFD